MPDAELSEGASNNAIVSNRVYTSGAHGITLGGAGGGNLVVNNLVYDHAESGIRVIGTAGSTSIRNNTVYGNRYGIRVDSPAVIRNNVAAGNAGVGLLDLGGPGTVNDYNCIQAMATVTARAQTGWARTPSAPIRSSSSMKSAHLAPEHRLAAVEALVRAPELSRNFTERPAANQPTTAK